MKKYFITTGIVSSLFTVPLAFAQFGTNVVGGTNTSVGGSLGSLLATAQGIVNNLVPFLIGLAVIAFFWFLVEFIWKGRDDASKKKEALSGMGYSILALFVMVAIWGLVGFISSVTGVGVGGSVPTPSIPTGPAI